MLLWAVVTCLLLLWSQVLSWESNRFKYIIKQQSLCFQSTNSILITWLQLWLIFLVHSFIKSNNISNFSFCFCYFFNASDTISPRLMKLGFFNISENKDFLLIFDILVWLKEGTTCCKIIYYKILIWIQTRNTCMNLTIKCPDLSSLSFHVFGSD